MPNFNFVSFNMQKDAKHCLRCGRGIVSCDVSFNKGFQKISKECHFFYIKLHIPYKRWKKSQKKIIYKRWKRRFDENHSILLENILM
jgi:hypothetical protein